MSITRDVLARPGSEGMRSWILSLLLAVSGWIVLGIVTAQAPTPVRTIAVFGFVLICPGAALIRLLRLRDPLERVVLGLAIGLSLATLISEVAALGHPVRAQLVLVVLASVCTVASVAEMVRGMRARS
jgi:drug/metabolite transporter (DMT)-like permease